MVNESCPFCLENKLLRVSVLHEDELWYITDMQEGSITNAVMGITKRHIATPFEISQSEWVSLQHIISKMKRFLDEQELPQGYTIGWNVGEVGGQNVSHVHLHMMARYGDEPLAGKGLRYAFKQAANKRPEILD